MSALALFFFKGRTNGRTDSRDGTQGDMTDTMVISRSFIHPHNLPALLESEDDERERKGKRGESQRAKRGERVRERATGRQKYTKC